MPRTRSSRRSNTANVVLKSKDNNIEVDGNDIDTSSPSDMKKNVSANKGGKDGKINKKKRTISDRSPALEKARKKSSSESNDESESLSTPTKDEGCADKENNPVKVGVTPYWKVAEERGISPRLTRSAQKSKRPCDIKRNSESSPPNSLSAQKSKRLDSDIKSVLDLSPSNSITAQQKSKRPSHIPRYSDSSSTPSKLSSAHVDGEQDDDENNECTELIFVEKGNSKQFKEGSSTENKNRFCLTFSPEGRLVPINDTDKPNLLEEISYLKKKVRDLQTNLKIQEKEKKKVTEMKESFEAEIRMMHNNFYKNLIARVSNLSNDRNEQINHNKNDKTKNDSEQELVQMINGFREENKKLQSKLDDTELTNMKLTADLENFQLDVNEYETIVSNLTNELNEQKKQIEELLKRAEANQETSGEVETLKEQNSSLKRSIKSLEEKIRDVEVEYKQAADEKTRISNRLDDILASMDEKDSTISMMSHKEAAVRATNEELLRTHDSMRIELEQKNHEIQQLKENMSALALSNEKEIQLMESQEEAVNKVKSELMYQNDILIEKNYDLSQKHEAGERMIRHLTTEVENLKKALQEVHIINEDLQRKCEMSDYKAAEMNKEADRLKQCYSDLENINVNLSNELVSSNERHEREKSEWKDNISCLESKLQACESERTSAKSVFETQQHELRKLLKLEKETNERMNEQMFETMEQFEKDRNNFKKELTEKEHAIEELRKRCKAMMTEMSAFNSRENALFEKILLQEQLRRSLHNKVMQLSGNIRVFIRVRPTIANEIGASPFAFPTIFDSQSSSSNKSITTGDDLTKRFIVATEPPKDRGGLSQRQKKLKFGFDNVFDQSHGQEDIWNATEPLIQSAVDGYNVCVFAYGQTGSGKTYTMLGNEENPGLITKAIEMLFKSKQDLEEASKGKTRVRVSIELLEIYNEQVRDLLGKTKGNTGYTPINLSLSSNEAVGNEVYQAKDKEKVIEVLLKAQKRRCVKATKSNAESSRSHLIFTLNYNVISESGEQRKSKLSICDLAGSERLSKSQSCGSALKEAQHINTSLSTLSNVIEKLQNKSAHIPFRDSKLTYLLQNSLCGDSKTLAIICCNPLSEHFQESTCSLRFAQKLNKVELKALGNISC